MFDAPPPNLPVEPTPSSAPPVPPPSASDSPAPGRVLTQAPPPPSASASGNKEPEDIFAGLDADIEPKGGTVAPPVKERGGSVMRTVLLIFVGLIVLGGIGFGVWYFFLRTAPTTTMTPTPTSVAPVVVPSASEPVVEVPPIVEPSPTPPLTEPVTTSPDGTNIPSPTPPTGVTVAEPGLDRDGDGLTDVEEVLYGTDALSIDSDGDGFADGAEVKGGYDPAAPKQPITASLGFRSILLKDVASSIIPTTWTDEGAAGMQYINTGTSENMRASSFRTEDLQGGMTIAQWVTEDAQVPATGLTVFRTRSGLDAWQTPDGRRTYFDLGDTILVLAYDSNLASSVEFRATYALLVDAMTRL
ncbi:hypothetical protein KJ925_00735 [Patescibacteria group bacterium]|nr:hypothetical protein [Patescibacteria group bacterium]